MSGGVAQRVLDLYSEIFRGLSQVSCEVFVSSKEEIPTEIRGPYGVFRLDHRTEKAHKVRIKKAIENNEKYGRGLIEYNFISYSKKQFEVVKLINTIGGLISDRSIRQAF